MNNSEQENKTKVVDNSSEDIKLSDRIKDFFFKPKTDMTIEQLRRRKWVIGIVVLSVAAIGILLYPIIKESIARKTAQSEQKVSHEVLSEDQAKEDWQARVDQSVISVQKENEELKKQNEEIMKILQTMQDGGMIGGDVTESENPGYTDSAPEQEKKTVGGGNSRDLANFVLPQYESQKHPQAVSPDLLPQTPPRPTMTPNLPPVETPKESANSGADNIEGRNSIYVFRPSAKEEGASGNQKKRQILLPTGSFMKGRLLSGVEAPTGGIGEKTPVPVIINLNNESYLPNEYRTDLVDCFVIGSAKGNASTVKADIRLTNISCVDKKKRVMSKSLQGWVFGPDGKYGVRGTQISQQGSVLRMHLLSALVEGFGGAYKDAASDIVTTAEGTVSSVDPAKAFKVGAYNAIGAAGASLADFYLDMAKSLIPIIEVQAGAEVSLVLEQDLELDFNDFRTVANNPLAKSGRMVE